MRGNRGLAAVGLAGLCALGVSACGGGERQDAGEPSGTWRLEVVDASFPTNQSIADATELKIRVRNADSKAAPNVAVTLQTDAGKGTGAPQAFASDIADPQVADRSRPIWIVDKPPAGGDSAYTNTWALGPLKPGQEREFVWRVTAVKAGKYKVGYAVSPGLNGKAKLAGGAGTGTFNVVVDDAPPDARVDDNGDVIKTPASGG